jgi:LacI family transcriptional regulator
MARGSGGPTITQVAEAAGVSRATVSRVLNGRTSVDPMIGARVRDAADRLHYRPNLTARNLSTGRTLTVALVIPDLGNPMFQAILRSISRAAEADGYSVLVAEAPAPEREAAIIRDARRQCDAVVLVSPRMDDVVLDELIEQIAPVVLVNRRAQDPRFASVGIDYTGGMTQLVRHLEGFGHRDLLYVAGPPRSAANRERLTALNTLTAANPAMSLRSLHGGTTMSDGYQVAEQVLDSGATAVLAFNDLLAFGILARLNEFGVGVPGDLSVTGFDGIELSRFAVPRLTTVGQEELDAGAVAWTLLRDRLRGAGSGDTSDDVLLEPQLLVGDSTGRVPPSRVPRSGQDQDRTVPRELELQQKPLGWVREGREWTLLHGGTLLAAAVTGASMAPVHSPRPHLHPVRSLAGRAMTTTNPTDHRHHFGVSLALPDVNGTTFWGGRTFVEGQGSTLLANQGRQESDAEETADNGRDLHSLVRWRTHDGSDLLLEHRRVGAFLLPEQHGWGLDWRSRLEADAGDIRLTSPANKGRLGAGYGGLFWRLPSADETRILVEGGKGESVAHGSSSPYVVIQRRHGNDWTSLVMIQDEQAQGRIDPWFVRASDYVGIGTSLAWSRPRDIEAGTALDLRVRAVVLDHPVIGDEVPDILASLPTTDDARPAPS